MAEKTWLGQSGGRVVAFEIKDMACRVGCEVESVLEDAEDKIMKAVRDRRQWKERASFQWAEKVEEKLDLVSDSG